MSNGERAGLLGLGSGIGLVAANMIGAGVFMSAGYMAQEMSPSWILIEWILGVGLALAGARAYAEVARMVPRSGGEYRYLSELVHPSLGYLAGWASLLVGFSAPIAINAVGASEFLGTIVHVEHPRLIATLLIVALTLFHSLDLNTSKWTQDALIIVKVTLLVGFVIMGLVLGSTAWPEWMPPGGSGEFEAKPFFGNMFWVAFAFSGWNAAIYAASEFRNPSKDVPRAMLIGCAAVGILYLLVNYVFVANLTPEDAAVVFQDRPVTLGHAVTEKLIGPTGAKFMSGFVVLAFVSAMSAMTLVGPRVYAAMADDGFLPGILSARAGRPPIGSIVFQSAVALTIVWTHSVRDALESVGALLVLFSALTVLTLFVLRRTHPEMPKPRPIARISAAIYLGLSAWILFYGVRHRVSTQLLFWAGAVMATALTAYLITERFRRSGTADRAG